MSATTDTLDDRIEALVRSARERIEAAGRAYALARRGAGTNEPFEAVEYDAADRHARSVTKLAHEYDLLTGPQPHLATWTMDKIVRTVVEIEDVAHRSTS